MKEIFDITEDHLTLLQRMYVRWEYGEWGSPTISNKRPYGNSDVLSDIQEILGWEIDDGGGLTVEEDLQKLAYELHRETETALQICLGS